jgi:energy-coupling factor transporter ATP-binding protein EcfA2
MKIKKILIKNFKAFQAECVIDLYAGKNLLLYGENGSGKSSLFQALNLFFSSSEQKIIEHKNIFIGTDDGYVKLEIGDLTRTLSSFEWSLGSTHPFKETLIFNASKTKGFLDYKALLQTHFVHTGNNVNVFKLLIDTLFTNIENPISKKIFQGEYYQILNASRGRRSDSRTQVVNSSIKDFNSGITILLNDLNKKINDIIGLFEQKVTISLALRGQGLVYSPQDTVPYSRLTGQVIELKVDYAGKPISDHHHLLNEARLSAIAISIYLAALLFNPPSDLRILFLDDVLIGLDMSNRLPLLDILEDYFSDWQIIVATYDRVWFEMVRQRVDGTKWHYGELYCCSIKECDYPVYKSDTDFLVIARQHLENNDQKAAAIYIRSAYESAIKIFCRKHNLRVRYCENPREQTSDDFWQVIKLQVTRSGVNLLDANMISNMELFRATILNQLSHTAPVNLVNKEVRDAFDIVKALKDKLQSVNKGDLA